MDIGFTREEKDLTIIDMLWRDLNLCCVVLTVGCAVGYLLLMVIKRWLMTGYQEVKGVSDNLDIYGLATFVFGCYIGFLVSILYFFG
ncbi:MAG: hypothetical protein WC942_07655 [Clostridia bacterium]|jgi:hypothetical protein